MLNPTMQYGGSGLALTEGFEGLKLTAYPDPASGGAPWTIGYGHTGPEVVPGLTITQFQAEQYLLTDVQTAVDAVNRYVSSTVTQNEFDAMVDFTFNLGAGRFAGSTLLKLVNAGDFDAAANEFEKWDMAGGQVMAGLLRRRVAEHDLFLTAQS